jgi:patatin-like phospholipase/acyl hydrolase
MLMTEVPAPKAEGQRRLLACDGGGIRGILSLEILAEMERKLRREYDDEELVLADYFDYIAGTSTGAMIAAGLALGWPVERLMGIYLYKGPNMFAPLPWWKRVQTMFGHKFPSDQLAADMRDEYGEDTRYGDAEFKSLLLTILHNSNTDSPWPLSNNPQAKYNDPERPDCNLNLPLWEVVRGSTAFPLAYPPEPITLGGREFVFVDGALTPYNNPALQLYFMATVPEYRLSWETGVDKLLLVSVGTGMAPQVHPKLEDKDMHALHTAKTLLPTLLGGPVVQQDMACRMIGKCIHGAEMDRELGDLSEAADEDRKFSYVRYNALLTERGLEALGLPHLAGEKTRKGVKSPSGMKWVPQLREIGCAVAKEVDMATYANFRGVRRG